MDKIDYAAVGTWYDLRIATGYGYGKIIQLVSEQHALDLWEYLHAMKDHIAEMRELELMQRYYANVPSTELRYWSRDAV